MAGIGLAYGPAWPSFWLHFQRPETNWLTLANPVAPLYQTLLGWVWTVVALPVEEQPLGQIVVSALLMLQQAIEEYRKVRGEAAIKC